MAVLLLDDDADLRESLELVLYEAGATDVLSFGTVGELQADAAQSLSCTCAVLDVNLGPDEPTGLDAAHWLRDHGFAGRIVFLTGHAGRNPLIRQACDEPNTVLAEKPTSFTRLLEVMGAS